MMIQIVIKYRLFTQIDYLPYYSAASRRGWIDLS